MAETVKKSKIVSEEDQNLEEALLEEFNMRLKNCMSNDDLQNAVLECDNDSVYENLSPKTTAIKNKDAVASDSFIENERQSYYESSPMKKNGLNNTFQSDNIYETLPELDKTDDSDQYVDMQQLEISPKIEIEHVTHEECQPPQNSDSSYELVDPEDVSDAKPTEDNTKSVKDRMFLATDDVAATLLFTQTVTSPMLTPSEENIDFLKGFQTDTVNSTDTTVSGDSLPKTSDENSSVSEPSAEDLIDSSKECIYENAEFLKQQNDSIYENLRETIYENLRKSEEEEHIYQDIEECVAKDEALYESLEDVKEQRQILVEEVMVENTLYNQFEELQDNSEVVTDLDIKENHFEIDKNYESIKVLETAEEIQTSERTIENEESNHEMIETQSNTQLETVETPTIEITSNIVHPNKSENNYYEKYTEVVSKQATDISPNRENDTETVPPEIVKNLKNQFLKTGAEVVAATSKKDLFFSPSLRTVNIMKQVNKFEHKDAGDGSIVTHDEGIVTEHYTETTTVQSGEGQGEKSLKKKKTKKSRKEEKENISVNELDVVNGENVYNVNVNNLCRSFGDLTKISEEKNGNNRLIKTAGKEKFNIVENKNPLGIMKTPFKNSWSMKSSFSKFDALQKKNVLHVRSSDSAQAQEKFNGSSQIDTTNCKACAKQVFQMEQIKAEKAIWHKNCFRCTECSKQLTVETYVSHEGNLYCKPHFKSLFAPKVVEDEAPSRPRKPELIIRENQPLELPPDVVRASDKPDLGLEQLQSLNVKERFQVFEHHQTEVQESDRGTPVNVKRSPSILSKLARFQAKGMDVGVPDDALNGIPIEESSSEEEEEEEEEVPEGEDPTLYKARKAHKEKPFHFTKLNEVKNKWEHGEQNNKDERREERKQEIQSIRNKLFLGKQGKMKEAYQQAIMQSESSASLNKSEIIESCDTKSLKERFEKGEMYNEREGKSEDEEDNEVFQSEISKKSRSLFLELDANASKAPQISPITPPKTDVRKARESYLAKTASEDTVKSSEVVDDVVQVQTADIQQRFKFFETYKEPEKQRKQFRITPPRDPSQVKTETPEREIYHDPDVVRSEGTVDDSVIAKTTHTASKMLNKFRQMEENLSKEPENVGPKPLKRFTPPPEPTRPESSSREDSGSEEESEEDEDQTDNQKIPEDLLEAQKAARAKQLRAKFEKWEAQEIKREQTQSINIVEEYGEDSQTESTRSLRARFEQMRDVGSDTNKAPRVKVNRFVEIPSIAEACESCEGRVYPLEKISIHGHIYHKNCFKCMECSCILRMDSYSYNQGLLYCIPHFKRLFISKGNYDSAFGLDQHKEKWNINATMA